MPWETRMELLLMELLLGVSADQWSIEEPQLRARGPKKKQWSNGNILPGWDVTQGSEVGWWGDIL